MLLPSRRARTLGLALVALHLGACAPAPIAFGNPAPALAAGQPRSFTMAQDGAAAEAVRDALLAQGLQEQDDGALRMEVGFAVRPLDLALLAPGDNGQTAQLSPAGSKKHSFCQRQAYVLTVAMVERETGLVQARGGATVSRCQGTPADLLAGLARAALTAAR